MKVWAVCRFTGQGGGSDEITAHELALAQTITNRLALALVNLRLSEKLRAQSIRDPLTGLFNRRYLEETLEREIACRVGGEEFLLVLPEADAETASQRAEDLRKRVESLELGYQGRSLGKITISLGIATLPAESGDQQELLRKADAALYQAKRQGRNQVVLISESA